MRSREKNNAAILGIDPGSLSCGYGIISPEGGYVTSGRIVLTPGSPLHLRLKELHEELLRVIDENGPYDAAVEKIFFAKGVKAALSLGHARGVAILAAASRGLGIHEYSPLEVKKAVTGYGRAEKIQVQEMVKNILSIKSPLSSDSADALATALCHLNSVRFQRAVGRR